MQKIKWGFAGLLVILVLGYLGLWSANYYLLQSKVHKVITEDSRNEGLNIHVNFLHLYDYQKLVINYRNVAPPAGGQGIFRSLFQIAHHMSDRDFEEVIIAYHGVPRLMLDGDTFVSLGERYGTTKPIEMLILLATNLRFMNGNRVLAGSQSHYAALLKNRARGGALHDAKIGNAVARKLFQSLTKKN